MATRLRGHKQRKLHDHVYFFCLCLLGLTIKLNFNISKVPYYVEGLTWDSGCTVVGYKYELRGVGVVCLWFRFHWTNTIMFKYFFVFPRWLHAGIYTTQQQATSFYLMSNPLFRCIFWSILILMRVDIRPHKLLALITIMFK